MKTRMLLVSVTVLCALTFVIGCAERAEVGDRVLHLQELSHTDIDKINRTKSIVFITFGNLEEHGLHLAVGTDYYMAVLIIAQHLLGPFFVLSDTHCLQL